MVLPLLLLFLLWKHGWMNMHEVSFDPLEKPFFSTTCRQEIAKHESLRADYWVNSMHSDLEAVAPEVDDPEGALLPTSLDDFTPHLTICRFHVPLLRTSGSQA